jgi:hypothetical protein
MTIRPALRNILKVVGNISVVNCTIAITFCNVLRLRKL